MIRLFSIICLLSSVLCLSSVGLAKDDPLVRAGEPADLGQGLGYLRAHSLDEAIKPLAGNNALVLDLRRTTATPEAVASFAATLASRPVGSRLFILVSPDTPAALAGSLKGHLITLGVKGSRPTPQVVVEQSPEADRHAYDAFAGGTTLTELISGKIEKERFDEASLVHEFKNGHSAATPAEDPSVNPPGPPAEPVTDRVLQRALHLHRALRALRR